MTRDHSVLDTYTNGFQRTRIDERESSTKRTVYVRTSGVYELFKRIADFTLAILLLPLLAAICVIVAILNPFLNPGPIFFTQIRVGCSERSFRIIKLRTMVGSTENTSLCANESGRIPRFGSFLRSRRIDEIPQILNVLMGHMSFIGPRPEQIELYETIVSEFPEYRDRQFVKPGITGLAQVRQGYARSMPELRRKLNFDMFYIQKRGFKLDALIMMQTIKVVFTGFGAR